MKVGIVAGEKSGDYLGAELIRAIKTKYPNAQFVGLAGPLMQAEGARSLADMDKISIMGVAAAVKGIRDILSIRKKIRNHMLEWQPDVFVGIDVPDFNLRLEMRLKKANIPTVHYVSPTVWAWRSKRIVKIKKAVNMMLVLFPFEKDFYLKHDVKVYYVGHPLADEISKWRIPNSADSVLDLTAMSNRRVIALLPGSRTSEVTRLAPVMLAAAKQLKEKYEDLTFVLPAANDKLETLLKSMIEETSAPISLVAGHSRDVLGVCHMAVLASGTAALEAALFAKPMVVMYKVSKLEEKYAARTMAVKHFSMPNHLTNPPVVPELIQGDATVEKLMAEVELLLNDSSAYAAQKSALSSIAPNLIEDSGRLALEAIEGLLATGAKS